MSTNKKVWIYESINTPIKMVESADNPGGSKAYIFDGLAADFHVNENGRLYQKPDYLSKIEPLQEKIQAGSLWGELDHPERYNVLVKEAACTVRKLEYDEASDTVQIRIELFDNDKGAQVKGIVDKGGPVYISSRASGYIDEEGNVVLERIYTYDIVYEPGFKNAKLERLNESLGISNTNVGIYEMKETINTEEKILPIMDTKKVDTNKENVATPLLETKFNEYTEETSKMFENLRKEFGDLKTSVDEINEGADQEKIGKISETLNKVTVNFNAAMDVFESHNGEFRKLVAYTKTMGRTVNKLLEHLDKQNEAITEMKAFKGKIVDQVNLVANITNENLEEVDANITQLKQYHNLSATTTNSLVEMSQKLVPHMNLIAESVNELASENNITGKKIEKISGHINTVTDTVHENFVEKAVFAFTDIAGTEKEGFTANITLDDDACGTIAFTKATHEVKISKNYSSIDETIKKSLALTKAFEALYKEKYGVEYSTIQAIKENKLGGGISRSIDEAIRTAKTKSAVKKAENIASGAPFLKVISEEAKAIFGNLSEAKQQRVAKTVYEKTLLKATEIENAIGVIAGYNDDMILLESHLTGDQVERWEPLNEEKKEIIYSMFSSRVIRNKDEFDEFFESLDWRKSDTTEPLNERKVEKSVADSLLEHSPAEILDNDDDYINARLGLS